MITLADRWNVHDQHFWLAGRTFDEPVKFIPELGQWAVYGYPEAQQIIQSPEVFSSNTVRLFPAAAESPINEGNILMTDPPDHRKLRQLVSHAFTPKVVAAMEPRIVELTDGFIADLDGRERIEMVADFAFPLPVVVIAELLGVPGSDRHLFKKWVDKLCESSNQFSLVDETSDSEADFQAQLDQISELLEYLGEHVTDRRKNPRQDLLSHLVEAEVDGVRLSDNEIVNVANLVLLAGHMTSTLLLGNTVLCLDTYPDVGAAVKADPTRMPGVVEEALRFFSPFSAVARSTVCEVEVGDVTIPKDQLVMLWTAAANRDERQFSEPEHFDPTRDPNPHLGFGRGIHFCMGAPLARLEVRIALNSLLARFPDLHTDPEAAPTFMPSPEMAGVRTLPLLTSKA